MIKSILKVHSGYKDIKIEACIQSRLIRKHTFLFNSFTIARIIEEC